MQPLLEPAVLVSENCPDCHGTGEREGEGACGRCDGDGRELHEVPLSEFHTMMQDAQRRVTAPPPSVLRQTGGS